MPGKKTLATIRPFDDCQRRIEIIFEIQSTNLVGTAQAIEIVMTQHVMRCVVYLQEGIGWAGNLMSWIVQEAADQFSGQCRLARTKIARQRQDVPGAQPAGQRAVPEDGFPPR